MKYCKLVINGFVIFVTTLSCGNIKEIPFHVVDQSTSTSEFISCLQKSNNDYILFGQSNDAYGADDIVVIQLTAAGDTIWVSEFGSEFNDIPLDIAESNGSIRVLYKAIYPDSAEVFRLACLDRDGLILNEITIDSYAISIVLDSESSTYLMSAGNNGVLVEKFNEAMESQWRREFLNGDERLGRWGHSITLSNNTLFLTRQLSLNSFGFAVVSLEGELLGSDQIDVNGFFWVYDTDVTMDGNILVLAKEDSYLSDNPDNYILLSLDATGSIISNCEVPLSEDCYSPQMVSLNSEEVLFMFESDGDAFFSMYNSESGGLSWTESWSGNIWNINDAILTNAQNVLLVGAHTHTSNINHSSMAFCLDPRNPTSHISDIDLPSYTSWNNVLKGDIRDYGSHTSLLNSVIYDSNNDILICKSELDTKVISPYSTDTLAQLDQRSILVEPTSEGGYLLTSREDQEFVFYDGNYEEYRTVQIPDYIDVLDAEIVFHDTNGLYIFGTFTAYSEVTVPGAIGDEGRYLTLLSWEGEVVWSQIIQEDHGYNENTVRVHYMSDCTAIQYPNQIVVAYSWYILSEDYNSNRRYREPRSIRVLSFDLDGELLWYDNIEAPSGTSFNMPSLSPASGGSAVLLGANNGTDRFPKLYDSYGTTMMEGATIASGLAIGYNVYSHNHIGFNIDEERITEMKLTGEIQREFLIQSVDCHSIIYKLSLSRDGDIVICGTVFDSYDANYSAVNENVFAIVVTDDFTFSNREFE